MSTVRAAILPNPEKYEVLVTVSTIAGHSRKLVTVAVYIPPGYSVGHGRACMSYVSDTVIEIKRKYREPFIVVAGDFNQWEIGNALEDFTDIGEVSVGPTRGDASIDRILVNFKETVSD